MAVRVFLSSMFLSPLTVVHRSYRKLAPRTRLYLGIGIMIWAGLGIILTDRAEEKFDLVPTEKDKERLEEAVPRIRFVERNGNKRL